MNCADPAPYDRRKVISGPEWLTAAEEYIDRILAHLTIPPAAREAMEIPPGTPPRPGPWRAVALTPVTPEIVEEVEPQRLICFIDDPEARVFVAAGPGEEETWVREVGTREHSFAATGVSRKRRILVELVERRDALSDYDPFLFFQRASECRALFHRDVAERCADWWVTLGLQLPTEIPEHAWISFVSDSLIDRAKIKPIKRSFPRAGARTKDGEIDDLRLRGYSLSAAVETVYASEAETAAASRRGTTAAGFFADKRRDYRNRFYDRRGESFDAFSPELRSVLDREILRSHVEAAVAQWPIFMRDRHWVHECNRVTGHFVDQAQDALRDLDHLCEDDEERKLAQQVAGDLLRACRAMQGLSDYSALAVCFPEIYEAIWRGRSTTNTSLLLLTALANYVCEEDRQVISHLSGFLSAFRKMVDALTTKHTAVERGGPDGSDVEARLRTLDAMGKMRLVPLFVCAHSSAVRLATGASTMEDRTNLLARAASSLGERWEIAVRPDTSFPTAF
ncbi:hypothetical protein [Brevundimonas sp.]|uniref:hypothetical protein n=1 Tax=Brevundimonas sp. TaxID=1871086 RepID=UPI0035668524